MKTNTNNIIYNILICVFAILLQWQGLALPDVLPQNITLSSSAVVPGGTVTVNFNIANQGTTSAAATTTRLRLNQSPSSTSTGDTSLGNVSTPSIAAGVVASGLSKLVTIPAGTAAGKYYIWVVADNGSVLRQPNYENDYAHSSALTVQVVGQPDVLPQNIALSSSAVAPGGTVTVTFNIANHGKGNAVATTTRLRLNQSLSSTSTGDTSLGNVSTPSIAANGVASGLSKLVTIPAGTAAGTYYIWVVADNGSVLTQPNYDNDYAHSSALTVQVVPQPILSVAPANPSIQSATSGAINLSVNNTGSGTMTYSASVTSGASWLSITSGGSGGNSGTVRASYALNSGSQRSGVIEVTANGASGSPVTITVTQSGSTGLSPFLDFPLAGYTAYNNKLVTAVFDHYSGGVLSHQVTSIAPDSIVEAFNGEHAETDFGNDGGGGYKKNFQGTPVTLDGIYKYTGTAAQYLQYDGHRGIDFGVATGTAVFAAAAGTVDAAGWQDDANHKAGFGLRVRLKHSNGYYTYYAHLSRIDVSAGATVDEGDQIGLSGSTGSSTGPHLHFEVRNPTASASIDPYGYRGSDVLWKISEPPAILSVTPESPPVQPVSAGSINLVIDNQGGGTMSYSATITSDSSWLSIASGDSGENGGTINVSYVANPGAQRSGTIQVSAVGAIGSPATVTIVQAGQDVDATPPVIRSFDVRPGTIIDGSSFTASFTVSDTGGSGLREVVLRRTSGDGTAFDPGWEDINTVQITGDGPASGSFTDSPGTGSYWYGMAVFDNATNSQDERSAGIGPFLRTVIDDGDTVPPSLEITSHTDGQTVTTPTIYLTGTATDSGKGDSGIAEVRVEGVRADNDTAAENGAALWGRELLLSPGPNRLTVIAKDNSPAGNLWIVTITVNYIVVEKRVIALSGNLSFGDVAVGKMGQRTLTIANTGNSLLEVSSISYPIGFSGEFSGSVPAGGAQKVPVTFAPSGATSYGGNLTVNSDKTDGDDTISVSGRGTTIVVVPVVETLPATSVTIGSAVLGGNVVNNGGASISEWRMEWSKSSGNWATGVQGLDWGQIDDESITVEGAQFTTTLNGLLPGTGYKYRVYARNSAGFSPAGSVNVVTFTTDNDLPKLTFSPGPGSYSSPPTVAIATAYAGAIIRYTAHGADPTSTSTIYSGPIRITRSMTLKAQAFKDGMPVS